MNHEREPNIFTDEEASPFKHFFDFKKFRKTQKAILSGDKLYEWNIKELRDRGYFEPLYFNIQESVFAALPTVAIVKILDWLYGTENDKFGELFQGTFGVLCAFVAPFVLTLLASLLAKASLKKNDLSPSKIDRARKAYLFFFFEGAYGLYLQGLFSLVTSLIIWMSLPENSQLQIPSELFVILLLSFLVLLALQLKVTWWNIPTQLFKINGYSGRSSPRFKYSCNLLFSLLGITVVNFVVVAFLSAIIAGFLMAIKG
ncbi:hypothetical protein [Microcoleus sp. B3-D7]|uniref:hypothetical protein n=1 Tax=Microcoleus sp. B3-D7 TaxID=2818659 RepID=UPI002FD26CF6